MLYTAKIRAQDGPKLPGCWYFVIPQTSLPMISDQHKHFFRLGLINGNLDFQELFTMGYAGGFQKPADRGQVSWQRLFTVMS